MLDDVRMINDSARATAWANARNAGWDRETFRLRWLTARKAVSTYTMGTLDAVVNTIPQYMDEGVFHLFKDTLVNLNLTSLKHQLHFLAPISGKVANHFRKTLQKR